MKNKIWGFLILLAVVVSAVAYSFYNKNTKSDVEINGLLGGEKIGLYESEEFKKDIKKTYKLRMDYRKSGSFDMLNTDFSNYDYLFPSSQLVLEMFEDEGYKSLGSDIIFNSPIVLYTRSGVLEGLIKNNLVNKKADIYYLDMAKLADMMVEEKTWADLGVENIYGSILVSTTDPLKSNSGNMFLGLLANALNDNRVVAESDLGEISPKIRKIYKKLGYMQTSSADIFNQFLRQGSGSYPLVAGYESQLLEFSKTDPELFDQVKDDIHILYPSPTVWSSHIYIALSEDGKRGLEALKDPEIQKLAWRNHGFRTIVAGTAKVEDFDVKSLAKDIDRVIPMPKVDVMKELMQASKP